MPTDHLPEKIGPNNEVDVTVLTDMETVAGSAYVNGDNRGVETILTAPDDGTADDAAATLDAIVVLGSDEATNPAVRSALDEVEVTQDGDSVVVSYEAAVGDIVDLVETAMESDSGGGATRPRPPQIAVSFDYDVSSSGDGTLTITHDGGDTVRQDELFLRGEGFQNQPGVDMTGPGEWAGSTSGEMGGQPAVVAGDQVTVGAAPEYDIDVVWKSADGDSSAALAAGEGPEN